MVIFVLLLFVFRESSLSSMRGLLKSDSVDVTSPTYHLVNSEGNQVKGGWIKAPLSACVYKCGILVIHAWFMVHPCGPYVCVLLVL